MQQPSHRERQLAVLELAYSSLKDRAASDSCMTEDSLQKAMLELLVDENPRNCCGPNSSTPEVKYACGLLRKRGHSRMIDELRRRRDLSLDAGSDDDASLGDALADRRDTLAHRLSALDAAAWRAQIEQVLPERHRTGWEALRLRAGLGLDAREIARATGVSADLVRQRMSRCAAWVRQHDDRSEPPLALAA